MELKEFIKKVIDDAIQGVDESSLNASRSVNLARRDDKRTIEFDVAVSAEEKTTTEGKAGVKVLSFIEAGGNLGSEVKNSTVSRITFGVDVNNMTKQEELLQQAQIDRNRREYINPAL